MAQDSGQPLDFEKTFREILEDVESFRASIRSMYSGSSEPPNPEPYMLWLDIDFEGGVNALKQRNAANTKWRLLWTLEGFAATSNPYTVFSDDASVDLRASASPTEDLDNAQGILVKARTSNRFVFLPNLADPLEEFRPLTVTNHRDSTANVIVAAGVGTTVGDGVSGQVILEPGDSWQAVTLRDPETEAIDWITRVLFDASIAGISGSVRPHFGEMFVQDETGSTSLVNSEFRRLGFDTSSEWIEGAQAGNVLVNEAASEPNLFVSAGGGGTYQVQLSLSLSTSEATPFVLEVGLTDTNIAPKTPQANLSQRVSMSQGEIISVTVSGLWSSAGSDLLAPVAKILSGISSGSVVVEWANLYIRRIPE